MPQLKIKNGYPPWVSYIRCMRQAMLFDLVPTDDELAVRTGTPYVPSQS